MTQEFVTLPREMVEQALEALKMGHESAHDCAETFHVEMAGYRQKRHDALDADVKQISDAIDALRAALEQQQGEQPLRYLDGGSRYKVTHLKTSGYCIIGLPEELLGRWVALVDATDNKHMDSHQQPPTTEQSSAVQQPRGEQEPVGFVRQIDIEQIAKTPSDWGAMFGKVMGFNTVPVYTHPQPKREPLTDEEIDKLCPQFDDPMRREMWIIGFKAVHGIK